MTCSGGLQLPIELIGAYAWAQFWGNQPVLQISDVVRELAETVTGLRAVNVYWDSGRLTHGDPVVSDGWEMRDGYAITPLIDLTLARNWPRSSCGWDEWYFFETVPERIRLEAYCNWGWLSLSDWREITYTGMNLEHQLHSQLPELVIAEGNSVFVISRREEVVSKFVSLWKKP
jgi:hypothetical protein